MRCLLLLAFSTSLSCTSVFPFCGWVTRDTHCFFAIGAVAGWVWLRAKPWDAELFSDFESISWGSSRGLGES